MRIALVVTQMNDHNLTLASQIGVTDIVGRYPGPRRDDMVILRDRVHQHGLRLSVIEGLIPLDDIVHGRPGRDAQTEAFQRLLSHMGEAGIDVCCYNFMPNDDWTRTRTDFPQRGGAEVTAFDADSVEKDAEGPLITASHLWENLHRFLEAVVPVAVSAGVQLAAHPDDPPLSTFKGHAQILYDPACFERLIGLVDHPANGICFCQGCFAEIGADIPATIRQLGHRINYAHFRDVCGCLPRFEESFHDNGKTDMFAAMQTYHEVGFDGPMRPDHAPTLAGESTASTIDYGGLDAEAITPDTYNGADIPVPPGYAMMGRLFAVGYMRGLIDAAVR